MAKSTTTKAKSKTTKKKASSKAVKTTVPKSSKKLVTKPSTKTTKKAVVAKSSKPATNSSRTALLRRPQVIASALYGGLAVAAGMLMNTDSAQIFIGHLSKDELASRASTVLAPAATSVVELEFRWLLVGLLVTAAFIALLRGTRYAQQELNGLKSRVQKLRWIELGVTGALAFQIVALLNGLQDLVALKLSLVSIIAAAFFGWLFERENAATGKPSRSLYLASAVAVIAPVLALIGTMFATYVYGIERSPWYAYAAAAVVSVWLLVTIRSIRTNLLRRNSPQNYVAVDRSYNRLSMLAKVALAIVLISGLYAN